MAGSSRAASSALVLLLLLSGCVGHSPGSPIGHSSDDPTPTTGDAAPLSFLNATPADSRPHQGLDITIEALSNSSANFTAANGRQRDPTPQNYTLTNQYTAGRACAMVGITQLRDGEAIFAWNNYSAESRGHLAFVATGGEPTAVEDGSSPESLTLGIESILHLDLEARKGDLFQVRLARDNEGRVFDPYVSLATATPAFRVVQQHEVAFTCGANLEDFRGSLVQQGMGLGSVAGHDLELTGTTGNGTEVLAALVMPYGGVCQLRLEVAGAVAADTGPQVRVCQVHGNGAPGAYKLAIPEVSGTGPAVFYFIWDVPSQG